VVAHQCHQRVGVVLVETEVKADVRHKLDTHCGVIRAGSALPDVVEEGRHHQQVRPGDVTLVLGCLDRRLNQVAVDGEPVHRVALRRTAHHVPPRDQAGHDASLVQ